MKKICVITDNQYIYTEFKNLIQEKCMKEKFEFYYTESNRKFCEDYKNRMDFRPIQLNNKNKEFFEQYNLFFSLHCKQIFPEKLVNNYRCINIHPGFNPHNRGWYPQVFSIINQKPIGVTIHEMDTELDHGPIIFQKEVEIFSYDTSYDVYQRIIKMEINMLKENLDTLILGTYKTISLKEEGNVNYKYDFDKICKLDMERKGTLKEHIDLLRATTFDGYRNAYFLDKDNNKIYVSITLDKV